MEALLVRSIKRVSQSRGSNNRARHGLHRSVNRVAGPKPSRWILMASQRKECRALGVVERVARLEQFLVLD